ncbi:MAG TPA: thioredoxin domain-containing protein [Solirubrobacterales bacterium]|jgi:protein-disulfide isomerase|nr:thioredoxin domain-containing protein [Solirubrobacterales bacterium]
MTILVATGRFGMEDHNGRSSSQSRDAQFTADRDEPGDSAAGTLRRRRSRALTIGVAGALVVIAVVMIASNGPGSSALNSDQTAKSKEINALLAGIPQSGNALGYSRAPVTLQYFVDLQCPTARTFTLASLPYVTREWVRTGTVRIEFRSLRSVSGPEAFATQQAAALSAGMQDKLWYFLEYFYHEQGPENSDYVTASYLASLARQVSDLNLAQWNEERDSPELAAQVTEDEQLAHDAQLTGTPSFLVGLTGSTPIYRLGESSSLGELQYFVRRVLHDQRSS